MDVICLFCSILATILCLILINKDICMALDNGLVLTPPMGWLSWTRFMCQTDCRKFPKHCISETLFLEMANLMQNEGFLDAGYEYVNIDDCWMTENRDSKNQLIADPERFPHGIAWLAKQLHSKGLKMGIYSNLGPRTCMKFAGTDLENIEADAVQYASFEADYLKFDACFQPEDRLNIAYPKMSKSLNRTGRPIVYSCSWPYYIMSEAKKRPDYEKVSKYCNLWRNFDDIAISWKSILSIIDFYDRMQDTLAEYHGPGHWNDPDMLIVGNPGLTQDQALSQMAIWCLWSAPLLMSNDLRDLAPGTRQILLNRRLIDMDQDLLGKMGRKFHVEGNLHFYGKTVTPYSIDGLYSRAFVIFNRGDEQMRIHLTVAKLRLDPHGQYEFQDLVSGETVDIPNNFDIHPDSVLVIKAFAWPKYQKNQYPFPLSLLKSVPYSFLLVVFSVFLFCTFFRRRRSRRILTYVLYAYM